MSDIATDLHAFIAEEAGLAPDEFDNQTKLFSEGFIDSFTMTAVIAYIEEETGIEVPQSAITLENFDTIAAMAAFIAAERA